MYHGLDPRLLFSACRLKVEFGDIDTNANIGNKCGTGFFMQTRKQRTVLISNRHVFDWNYRQRIDSINRYVKILSIRIGQVGWDNKKQQPTNFIEGNTSQDHFYLILPDDYCTDVIGITGIRIKDFFEFIPHWIGSDQLPSENELKYFNVCDAVVFPSYNKFYDKRNNFPIMRTGSVASWFSVPYSNDDQDSLGDIYAIEAFSHGGSSGSPIFATVKGQKSFNGARKGFLAGIIAGHYGEERYTREAMAMEEVHSAISYAYKPKAIVNILEKVDNIIINE